MEDVYLAVKVVFKFLSVPMVNYNFHSRSLFYFYFHKVKVKIVIDRMYSINYLMWGGIEVLTTMQFILFFYFWNEIATINQCEIEYEISMNKFHWYIKILWASTIVFDLIWCHIVDNLRITYHILACFFHINDFNAQMINHAV